MAKKDEGAGAPDGGQKTDGDKPKEGTELPAARICRTGQTEREMFNRFMVAVAGRDDANYKSLEKIADDAEQLTKLWAARAGKFKD